MFVVFSNVQAWVNHRRIICLTYTRRHVLEIKKGKLVQEEKTQKWYATGNEGQVILHFKDDLSDYHKTKAISVKNKGKYNASIAASLFKYLEGYNVRTCFIKILNPVELLIKKSALFPLDLIVWNIAGGSLQKRFGIEKGHILTCPILEFYFKDNQLNYPMITMDHACAFGYATPDEMQAIDRISRKANAVLKSYFDRRHYKLADFRLNFGKIQDQIVIGDAVSADCFHLWDLNENTKSKSELFSGESDTLEETFASLATRLA